MEERFYSLHLSLIRGYVDVGAQDMDAVAILALVAAIADEENQ